MNETPQTPPNAPLPPTQPPVQPPVQAPVMPPVQPPAPNSQTPHDQTDILGIISIVMIFIALQPVGFVLGLIGASKAKREGRSPILSRIGWIANLVAMICITLVIVLLVVIGLNAQTDQSAPNTTLNTGSGSDSSKSTISSTSREDSIDGFSLVVPKTFTDLPPEYQNSAANYTQGDPEANEYALVIKESASDFRSTMTVQDYADLLNDSYKTGKTISNAVITPLYELTNSSNLDAVDYTMTGESGNSQIVYYIRYVKTATSFYQVMTWTSPSTASSAKFDLYPILESFREV